MREHNHDISDGDLIELNVLEPCVDLPMCERRHAFGKCFQDRRRAADGICLQSFASGEHQHDQRPGQVLVQDDGRDNRNACQQVGAELALQQLEQQIPDQGRAAQ